MSCYDEEVLDFSHTPPLPTHLQEGGVYRDILLVNKRYQYRQTAVGKQTAGKIQNKYLSHKCRSAFT